MAKHEWLLKRNCSLSPSQLGGAYAILCLMSFAVAIMPALRGAWHVFAFAVLEMAAVAFAFLHYTRHATDHEYIALSEDDLLVERVEGGQIQRTRLDPCRTRIVLPRHPQELICLQAGSIKIQVGAYVTAEQRRQFACELQEKLQRSCYPLEYGVGANQAA